MGQANYIDSYARNNIKEDSNRYSSIALWLLNLNMANMLAIFVYNIADALNAFYEYTEHFEYISFLFELLVIFSFLFISLIHFYEYLCQRFVIYNLETDDEAFKVKLDLKM